MKKLVIRSPRSGVLAAPGAGLDESNRLPVEQPAATSESTIIPATLRITTTRPYVSEAGVIPAAAETDHPSVIAGLDPAIHHAESTLLFPMDARVKPAHDESVVVASGMSAVMHGSRIAAARRPG
jgi:hypothetical protein